MRATFTLSLYRRRCGIPAALACVALDLGAVSCQRPPSVSDQSQARSEPALPQVSGRELRSVDVFDSYADRAQRSRALFAEAARVMLHPRCVNCHPSGDEPLQRAGVPHDPPVVRGPENRGVVGMECESCHQAQNLELARVPGAPGWHLAPLSMAWVGKDARQLCEQLQDRERNGNKSLAQIVEHSAHDELVAWGWAPGHGREPAPGSQQQFGDLMAAWVATGAECPESTEQP